MIAIYNRWPATKEESEKARQAAECALRRTMIALAVVTFIAGVLVLGWVFKP